MDKIKASTLADLAYYSRFKPPSRLITFAAPASTLTNFPALVKCNSTFHIGTQTGYDVHFQDLSGNELYFDLDFYDSVTGNGAWWVQIPSLPSSGPTSIKMLYGDPGASTDGSTPSAVWSDYTYIYHCSGSSPYADRIGGSNLTLDSGLTGAIVTGMYTGQGVELTSTGTKWARFGNTMNVSSFTCSTYAHATAMFMHQMLSAAPEYGFDGYSAPLQVKAAGLSFKQTSLTFPAYESLSYSGGSAGAVCIFNGTSLDCSSASQQNVLKWTVKPWIQIRPSCVFTLDEIRISASTQKSGAWLSYEQAQITDHATYTTYGSEV